MSWRNFQRKFLYQKALFYKTLSDLERKIFGLSAKLFSARLSKFHSTFAEEGFRENFLEKEVFFIASRLGAKSRLLKKHQFVCENFILGVLRKFWEKNFVSKKSFFVELYRTLREKFSHFRPSCFRHVCHHSILLLPRKVSGNNFSKKNFFIVYRLGAKNRLLKKR